MSPTNAAAAAGRVSLLVSIVHTCLADIIATVQTSVGENKIDKIVACFFIVHM